MVSGSYRIPSSGAGDFWDAQVLDGYPALRAAGVIAESSQNPTLRPVA